MLIKENGKYTIISKDSHGLTYKWSLTIIPSKRAWKLANKQVNPGDILNGYTVISALEGHYPSFTKSNNDSTPFTRNSWCQEEKLPISKGDFYDSVYTSGIDYAVEPSFHQAYRCDLCGGIVANDICTNCMFDWDS